MNPFLRTRQAFKRTPVRAEAPGVKVSEGGVATLRLYDPLDSWGEFWGVSAKEFTGVLDELPEDTTEIRLLINSPGGEVWEGLAILNALRAHPARVVAVVEGIAASAASFVAAGVDELHMMENAEIFVHKAWGLCVGNGDDMTKMADELAHEDRNIAAIYAKKSGGTVDEWLAAMAAETWYMGEEAIDAGLADKVIDGGASDAATTAKNRFDLSIFNRGRPAARTSATGAGTHRRKGATEMALKEEVAQRLGIEDADAVTDEQLLEALSEALDERADEGDGTDTEQTPEQLTSAAARFGLTLVDRAQYDATVAAAAEGRQARAQQLREADERVVDARIQDGAIAPAARAGWLAALDADRKLPQAQQTAKATLDALPKGLIPVAEIGHSQDIDPSGNVTENPLYKEWRL